ncbi:MAG: Rrf2 family transcriptional regulator, partial [Bacteroidota bacterium]
MGKLFNISEATIIAFHSLALMDKATLVRAETVSSTTRASKNHVLKVLNQLSKHGYIKSIRGPKGGFQLNKDPES